MRLVIGVCVLVSEDVVNGSVNPGRHLGASLWPCRVICIELSRVGLYRWNNAFLIQVSQWWRDSCNLSIQMFPSAFHCSFISLKWLFFTAAVFRVETERSHHIPVSPDDITMTSSGFFFLSWHHCFWATEDVIHLFPQDFNEFIFMWEIVKSAPLILQIILIYGVKHPH